MLALSAPFPAPSSSAQTAAAPSCQKWDECRALALEAEARGEFETFHDLAWRTMQTRGRNDPEVMRLLARAQARSGRPHDALVMLRRTTELGGAPSEALEGEAFARTRALPDWPAVEAAIARAASAPSAPETAPVSAPAGTPSAAPGPGSPVTASPPAASTRPLAASEPAAKSGETAPLPTAESILTFSARGVTPAGLAYDSASGRVLVGDRRNRRIITISERLKTSVDLVRAASAGFHDVLALAIDARQGDLWVASATGSGGDSSSEAPGAALHKLQLVSGRPLAMFPIDTGGEAARFTGLAVTRSGAVFALDGAGGRIWRLAPREKKPELLATLDLAAPAALAVDDEARNAYVAHDKGLARLALGNGAVGTIAGREEVDLASIESLAWSRRGLIAVERGSNGARRILLLRLTRRGTSIAAVDVLDNEVRTCAGASPVTVSDDDVYYLAADRPQGSAAADCVAVVRRVQVE